MDYTFEQAMQKLEEISKMLSDNNVTLDESLELYAEGVKLLNFCNEKISAVSVKIQEIEGTRAEDLK